MSIYSFFLMFLFYSFFGYLTEVIGCYILYNKKVNRGFLRGPWCPIYGIGFIMLIFISRLKDNILLLIFTCFFFIAFLEYLVSYLLEKIFKIRWWDYSKRKFNINGRICLLNLILFTIASLVMIYFINPFLIDKMSKIPNIITIILFIIFMIDVIISTTIISNMKLKVKEHKKDYTEEIDNAVKETLTNKNN